MGQWRHMIGWLDGWLRQSLPGYCAFCLRPLKGETGWCQACYADLPWNVPACLRCKEPLVPGTAHVLCGHCLTRPPSFVATTAELRYQAPLPELIDRFKNSGSTRAGRLLVDLMLANKPEACGDALLPVPMHPTRARARGFNQAHWLAERLAWPLAIPLVHAQCIKQLPAQRSLNRRQRLANLAGAFRIVTPMPRHVTIVDDVVTTGATGQALGAALLRAGVERVDIWAVARTPLEKS